MVEVRIRRSDEVHSHHLTEVQPTPLALQSICDLVSSWGTQDGDDVTGQFSTEGFFELVVGD